MMKKIDTRGVGDYLLNLTKGLRFPFLPDMKFKRFLPDLRLNLLFLILSDL
jgi:hypothetical protein